MSKYQSKVVTVDAVEWTGENTNSIQHFCPKAMFRMGNLFISTLEGTMGASIGDFIIKGQLDDFYPCKPDVFAARYESLHDR